MQPGTHIARRRRRITLHSLFIGPDGLRAIWALLLFDIVRLALRFVLFSAVDTALPHNHTGEMQRPGRHRLSKLPALAHRPARTWLMATIEGRRLTDYGLGDSARPPPLPRGLSLGSRLLCPPRVRSPRRRCCWPSTAACSPAPPQSGTAPLARQPSSSSACSRKRSSAATSQFTLTRGLASICRCLRWPHADALGFWTAALALSAYFGFGHGSNPGESPVGLLSAGLIGLVFCLSLWRTGSLWWAIGFHAAWDWMQSFFYGVSRQRPMHPGHPVRHPPLGDRLLSGGLTGPEGSLLVFPILALVTLVVALTLPSHPAPGSARLDTARCIRLGRETMSLDDPTSPRRSRFSLPRRSVTSPGSALSPPIPLSPRRCLRAAAAASVIAPLVLLLLLVIAAVALFMVRRHFARPDACQSSTSSMASSCVYGLAAPVTVQRDAHGVPHIHGQLHGRPRLRAGLHHRAGPPLADGPAPPPRRRRTRRDHGTAHAGP